MAYLDPMQCCFSVGEYYGNKNAGDGAVVKVR